MSSQPRQYSVFLGAKTKRPLSDQKVAKKSRNSIHWNLKLQEKYFPASSVCLLSITLDVQPFLYWKTFVMIFYHSKRRILYHYAHYVRGHLFDIRAKARKDISRLDVEANQDHQSLQNN